MSLKRHEGDALAITHINGIPIAAHQGAGSITDTTIRTLLSMPGRFIPHLIASLMHYPSQARTLARKDHGAYIEISYLPPAKPRQGGEGEGAPTPEERSSSERRRPQLRAVGSADRTHRSAARAERLCQAELVGYSALRSGFDSCPARKNVRRNPASGDKSSHVPAFRAADLTVGRERGFRLR